MYQHKEEIQTKTLPNQESCLDPDGPRLPLTSPGKWVGLDSAGRGSPNSSYRCSDFKPQGLSCPKDIFSLISRLTWVTGSSRKRLLHLIPANSTMTAASLHTGGRRG